MSFLFKKILPIFPLVFELVCQHISFLNICGSFVHYFIDQRSSACFVFPEFIGTASFWLGPIHMNAVNQKIYFSCLHVLSEYHG